MCCIIIDVLLLFVCAVVRARRSFVCMSVVVFNSIYLSILYRSIFRTNCLHYRISIDGFDFHACTYAAGTCCVEYRDSSVFVLTDDVQANKLPLPIDDLQNGITHKILFSCRNLINVIEIGTNQKTCLSSAPR